MSQTLRNMSIALALMVSAAPLLISPASALSMSECSVKFKAAKAAGTDAGMKWNDFRKAQCAADASAAAPASTAVKAAAPAAPAASTAVKPAAPAAAVATTPSGSFMKDCAAAWKGMKATNAVPAGMKWKDFVAGKCQVAGMAAPAATPAKTAAAPAAVGGTFMQQCAAAWRGMKSNNTVPAGMKYKDFVAGKCQVAGMAAPAAPADEASIPAEPPATATAEAPAATVDKNGKPLSASQVKFRARIHQCSLNWRADKASNKLPAGSKWPQYWSACNTQLKSQGM